MQLSEFLRKIEKPNGVLEKGFSEQEVRQMAEVDIPENHIQLQALFSFAKAMVDPSPAVRTMQEKMRAENADEALVQEMSTKAQMAEFPLKGVLWEAVRDAFGDFDYLRESGKDPNSGPSLESLYAVEEA